jgi:hypothetical protein
MKALCRPYGARYVFKPFPRPHGLGSIILPLRGLWLFRSRSIRRDYPFLPKCFSKSCRARSKPSSVNTTDLAEVAGLEI